MPVTTEDLKAQLPIHLPPDYTVETVEFAVSPVRDCVSILGRYSTADLHSSFHLDVSAASLELKSFVISIAQAIANQIVPRVSPRIAPLPSPGMQGMPVQSYAPTLLQVGGLNAAHPTGNDLPYTPAWTATDAATVGQGGYAAAPQAQDPVDSELTRLFTRAQAALRAQSEPND